MANNTKIKKAKINPFKTLSQCKTYKPSSKTRKRLKYAKKYPNFAFPQPISTTTSRKYAIFGHSIRKKPAKDETTPTGLKTSITNAKIKKYF